jgi:glycerophosphoryl diester phosphodiesterase
MTRRPLIIAHLGASAQAPENTLAAFRKAMDVGADGIEFDVRLAKDGVPVVFHDGDLRRIAARPEMIADLTSGELAGVDAGSWFNKAFPSRARPEFADEKISSLAETLELFSNFRGRIYIELKCTAADAEETAKAVCTSIEKSHLLPQMIIKSFTLAALPHVAAACPAVPTAALFEPTVCSVLRKQKNIIEVAEHYGADELSLHYSLATRRLASLAAERNVPITIWTVDNPRWLKKASERGIKALITNDPEMMMSFE